MPFPRTIKEAAFDRQRGRCAMCGKNLCWENYLKKGRGAWQAHHINGKNLDHRLRNCACLCVNQPERCHYRAHEGDYGGDWILASTFFPYLNG